MAEATLLTERLLQPRGGLLLFLLRLVLLPPTLLWYLVSAARNALYDTGLLRATAVAAPVVSVGNLTVGGTGKTPLVIELARRGVAAGRRVAVVARRYGAAADAHGRTDEVALLAARCPEARVVTGPNTLRAAGEAADAGADLIVVDDGLQHRALHRDFEIVVVDARAPFGNGMVVPGGPLREPAAGIARADALVLTHGDELSAPERESVESAVRAYRRSVPLIWAAHEPLGVRPAAGGRLESPDVLAGRDVHLFCGVASPSGVRGTLERLGARVTGVTAFGDHHAFTPADLALVRSQARTSQLVCTEKDALKVARIPGTEDVLCLVIEMRLQGELPPIPGLDAPWTPARPAPAEGHGAQDAHAAHPAAEAHAVHDPSDAHAARAAGHGAHTGHGAGPGGH
jgi:tetraacyldisaccharide 4'-kinase